MKTADIIKSAWKNIRVHKGETIKNIVLLALSVSIITISCMFTEKVTDVTYNIREQAALHVMSASYMDEADMKMEYEKFVNDDRVYEIGEGPLKAYNGVCTNTDELFDVDYDVMFFFNRYLDYYSQYCTYKGTLNDDEIILPKYLSIAEGYMWSDYFDTGTFIDTSSLVGKTMTIEMDFPEFNGEKMCLKKDFKIVGILDNVKSLHPGTEIFMNGNAIKEFKDFWDAEEERVLGPGDEVEIVGEYYMVLKDVDDVEAITDEHTHFGPTAYLHKNEVDNIDYIMKAVEDVGKVLFIFCILNVIISIVRSITKRMSEFAVMKAVGYEQKIINKMISVEIFITLGIGFVISMIMSGVLVAALNILKYYIVPAMLAETYLFSFEPWFIAAGFITVVISAAVAVVFSLEKITNTSLLKALKS